MQVLFANSTTCGSFHTMRSLFSGIRFFNLALKFLHVGVLSPCLIKAINAFKIDIYEGNIHLYDYAAWKVSWIMFLKSQAQV